MTPRTRPTGERAFTSEGGFNPSWQRHAACYELSAPFLPDGRILDIGCGTGHSFERLAPRTTVGLDVAPEVLEGQDRETVVADMRSLPFADGTFDGAIAAHSVEHVPDPERVVAEAARVVRPAGVVVLATPNRLTFGPPEEVIDPYHYVELAPEELLALCAPRFADVRMFGVFGSPRHLALVAEERARLERLLRRDPLRLRRFVPRPIRQRLYDAMLARERAGEDARAAEITTADFTLRSGRLEDCLDLIAVCRTSSGLPRQAAR